MACKTSSDFINVKGAISVSSADQDSAVMPEPEQLMQQAQAGLDEALASGRVVLSAWDGRFGGFSDSSRMAS